METPSQPSFLKQVYACFSMFNMAMSVGAVSGFSGIALPQLKEDFNLTPAQSAWFASLSQLGMISTCILGGILGQKLGRKRCVLVSSSISVLGFAFLLFATQIIYLQLGRFIAGSGGGLASGSVAVYISEVTTNKYRTTFGSGLSVAYLLGTILIYTLGSILPWRYVCGISAIFPMIGFLMVLTVPESPVWLITKGHHVEARKALVWLRGKTYEGIDEELESIQNHFEEIQAKHKDEARNVVRTLIWTFRRQDVYKPLCIVMTLMALQQFCGMSSITYYAVQILTQAKSSIDEYMATVIFGCIRFASQLLGSFLLIRFPRRCLFIFSALFMSMGTGLFGLSIFLNEGNDKSSSAFSGFLPLIAITISAMAYPIGLSPIPWSYTSELFPLDVRAEMCGLTNCLANIYIFCVVLSFPFLSEALTTSITFLIYSTVGLSIIVFALFFLPETKDRKLEDISKSFVTSKTEESDDANGMEGDKLI